MRFLASIAAITVALGATIASDSFVDAHAQRVQDSVDSGECSSTCLAYENPENLHLFHWGEECLLGALVLITVCSLTNKTSINWINAMVWSVSLSILFLLGGMNCLFEMITDGAQSQYGLKLAFMDSTMPMILLDAVVCIVSISLLVLGPPRGWDGKEEMSWEL